MEISLIWSQSCKNSLHPLCTLSELRATALSHLKCWYWVCSTVSDQWDYLKCQHEQYTGWGLSSVSLMSSNHPQQCLNLTVLKSLWWYKSFRWRDLTIVNIIIIPWLRYILITCVWSISRIVSVEMDGVIIEYCINKLNMGNCFSLSQT